MNNETPAVVKYILSISKLDIAMYDFRSISYRNKIYNITNSRNAGLYATFAKYTDDYKQVPTLIQGRI